MTSSDPKPAKPHASGQFCPVCKLKNDIHATECSRCGSPLDMRPAEGSTTSQMDSSDTSMLSQVTENLIENALHAAGSPTAHGLAVFLINSSMPIAVHTEDAIILGRVMGELDHDTIVDLTPYEAFKNGVSRRHAIIRREEGGYTIADLQSTNGTWLENDKLVPYRPVPLPSGAHIRLGRLHLMILYRN